MTKHQVAALENALYVFIIRTLQKENPGDELNMLPELIEQLKICRLFITDESDDSKEAVSGRGI
jgi:hypothetical protein